MRTLLLASAFATLALAGAASAQPRSQDRLDLFNRPDYQGRTTRLSGAHAVLRLGWNVNSVRVSGQTWRLCSGPNFTGQCATVTGDDPHFAARLPEVRSAERIDGMPPPGRPGPAGAAPPPPPPAPSGGSEIWFYSAPDYQGQSNRATGDFPNVIPQWAVNSVRVNGQVWQICSAPNYAGMCVTVSQSNPHFASLGLPSVRSIRRLDRRSPAAGHPSGGYGQGGGRDRGRGG